MRYFLLLALVTAVGCGKVVTTAISSKPVTPAGKNNTEGTVAGPVDATSNGRSLIARAFDKTVELALLDVGKAYRMVLVTGKPPVNQQDMTERTPRTTRGDKEPFEVIYGVDPKKLPDEGVNHKFAWESVPDADGGRHVLMGDLITVKYYNEEAFKKVPRADKK